jgi:hypothetical protein
MEPTTELINFELVLYSKYWNTPPYVEVSVDDEIKHQCKLTDEYTTIKFSHQLDFNMHHKINILRQGKTMRESRMLMDRTWETQECGITRLYVDDINIRNILWDKSYFEPEYDKFQSGDKIVPGECCFGFNGKWTLDFTSPFYQYVVDCVRGAK